jgi:outer membrane protein assembly factor BamB
MLAGATIRVAEYPRLRAVVRGDGRYDLVVPDRAKVTPYIVARGYHTIYLQTFTTDGEDLVNVNFQTPTDAVYRGLVALLKVPVDAHGNLVACAIVSTFSTRNVRDLSYAKFIAYGAHGVAGATATARPSLDRPVYFNKNVLPDPKQKSSSEDGGVVWTGVPTGVYTITAHDPRTAFASFVASCRPGRVINANPPWGLYQLSPPNPARVSARWSGPVLRSLRITHLPAAAVVTLRCSGRGCPFGVAVRRPRTHELTLGRLSAVRSLEVAVSAHAFNGIVWRWAIVGKRVPAQRTLCIPLGFSKPRRSCPTSPDPARASAAAAASPWPEMRHDQRNTGRTTIVGRYHGDRPWAFRTDRGVFSTPVLGADGTVYIGSGDTYFYAIGAGGRLRWRIKTGGVIDAGGALSAFDPGLGSAPLTFGSGDDHLYHVTTPSRGRPRVLWRFRASVPPVKGQQVDWWEGPVAIGPDGVLYAGNTGGTAYAIKPNGRPLWTFTAGGSLWTTPAFSRGSSYWGSLDLNIYKLNGSGRPVWHTFTPGFVISSPAIGSDGTVYVGSFDSKLYALDPSTGKPHWTFETTDHIYSSPALGQDRAGHTNAIYIASTDGSVYALGTDGRLRWRYDAGDPIRSSPVLGAAPGAGHHEVLYVGSSNGKLYALNADTGRRRWSYDTTPRDPALRDRNDLNASPALGRTGVYIAGEHGYVDYVPYDYCLHRRDPRCSTDARQEFGTDVNRVFPVSAGGSTINTTRLTGVSPATVLNLRLIVRRHGRTVNAAILDPSRVVSVSPRFPFRTVESGDGHFLYVIPRGVLARGTTYRVRIAGTYTDNGVRMGNFNPRGPATGRFDTTLVVRTAGDSAGSLPLVAGRSAVSAIAIRRLAVPMPAFLPSVNQIGFDSYDWIASTISRTRSNVLMWVIGAFKDRNGIERVDPHSAFAFPLTGRFDGRAVNLSSPNVALTFSFGLVPLQRFYMRGTLGRGLSFAPGASLYSETVCKTVPNYGPELVFTGICNPDGVLAASGTFLSGAYSGSANRRPAGVLVASVRLVRPTADTAGSVAARLVGPGVPSSAHNVAAVLLTDAATGSPVSLDYRTLTSVSKVRLNRVVLTLPPKTVLPARLRAYVMVDAFPVASRAL